MVDMTLIRPLNKGQSHYWVIIQFGSNFLEISCDFTNLGGKTVYLLEGFYVVPADLIKHSHNVLTTQTTPRENQVKSDKFVRIYIVGYALLIGVTNATKSGTVAR